MDTTNAFSTGSLAIDTALGCGGFPRGCIIEVSGPRKSGKTTLAIQAIAEVQRVGGVAMLIDADHVFDRAHYESAGVNISRLLVSQPENSSQIIDIAETLIRSRAVELIVINSVAAVFPKSTQAFSGADDVGYRSRLMSQALNRLTVLAHNNNVTLLFIHHHEVQELASAETTASATALRYYASVRLDVRRLGDIKSGGSVTGHRARVKVLKNKFATPFTDAVVDVCYGGGIGRVDL